MTGGTGNFAVIQRKDEIFNEEFAGQVRGPVYVFTEGGVDNGNQVFQQRKL